VHGIHENDAIKLISGVQLPAPPEAADVERWPWPLKIFTLGRFSILVNSAPLHFEGKVQHGPLNLLKALIALGSHDVAEHKLIDALWPDADSGAGEQSLATTLSRLRKLIGAHTIKRQDGHLSLEPALCWVDCWALERTLSGNATATSPDALSAMIQHLYRGHFLQGDDDAPWALRLRERLHVSVVAKLNQGAHCAFSQGDVELATRLYELGLQVDDLVEDFYAGLIRCHTHSGQASHAVTTYRQCQRVLAKRLGVMPSEKTTRLYLAAIEGKTAGPRS
jgi:LuxR family transcriptional regulator, maltose regulon positive regulatory protein